MGSDRGNQITVTLMKPPEDLPPPTAFGVAGFNFLMNPTAETIRAVFNAMSPEQMNDLLKAAMGKE